MTESQHPAPLISMPPKRAVFVCTRNSARSQIAEGLARSLAPTGTEIWSAGTTPGSVHPLAVQVMKEIGLDISQQVSKGLDDVPWRDADTVVTLCGEAREACPALSAEARRMHWPIPDPAAAPAAQGLEAFREARDEIRWRVSSLWPRSG